MIPRFLALSFGLGLFLTNGLVMAGDLEEILAKHYAARGGLDKLLTVRAMQFSGVLEKKATEIAFTYTIQGDRSRVDFVVRGKKLIRVYDGKKGWQINPLICADPQPLTRHETSRMRRLADDLTGPLVNWSAKGHQLKYQGLTTMMGMSLHKIRVIKKRGQQEIVYLDPNTFLERILVRRQHGSPPQFLAIKQFETLDGITFVKKVISCRDLICCLENSANGEKCKKVHRIRYDIRTINPSLDESFFALGSANKGQHPRP